MHVNKRSKNALSPKLTFVPDIDVMLVLLIILCTAPVVMQSDAVDCRRQILNHCQTTVSLQ